MTRITPTGQIVVEITPANGGAPYTYRFNERGREMNPSSKWRSADLISEDDYRRMIDSNKKEREATTIRGELAELSKAPFTDRDLPAKLEALARKLRAWQGSS